LEGQPVKPGAVAACRWQRWLHVFGLGLPSQRLQSTYGAGRGVSVLLRAWVQPGGPEGSGHVCADCRPVLSTGLSGALAWRSCVVDWSCSLRRPGHSRGSVCTSHRPAASSVRLRISAPVAGRRSGLVHLTFCRPTGDGRGCLAGCPASCSWRWFLKSGGLAAWPSLSAAMELI